MERSYLWPKSIANDSNHHFGLAVKENEYDSKEVISPPKMTIDDKSILDLYKKSHGNY